MNRGGNSGRKQPNVYELKESWKNDIRKEFVQTESAFVVGWIRFYPQMFAKNKDIFPFCVLWILTSPWWMATANNYHSLYTHLFVISTRKNKLAIRFWSPDFVFRRGNVSSPVQDKLAVCVFINIPKVPTKFQFDGNNRWRGKKCIPNLIAHHAIPL